MLLEVRLEEHVVLVEVRFRDLRGSNDLVLRIACFDDFLDGIRVDRSASLKQSFDRTFDGRLAHPSGQIKDFQVLAACTRRPFFQEFVVRHAEPNARKQVVVPAVVLERARLADEAVDHVSIVDSVLALAVQTRQTLGASLCVPDFEMFGKDANLHLLADQPTRHAVDVVLDDDRARTTNRHLDRVVVRDRPGWKRTECFAFLLESLRATGVLLLEHLVDKRLIGFAAGKIATATQ